MFSITLLQGYKKLLNGDDGWDGDPNWQHIVVLTQPKYHHDVAVAAANLGFHVIVIPDEVLMHGDSWGVGDMRHPGSVIWHMPL